MSNSNNSEYDVARKQYEYEAKERWGATDAYGEHTEKTSGYTQDQWNDAIEGMNNIFEEFANCKNSGASTNSEEALALVKKLQDYITEKLYTCTKEILAGLGQMYVCDERFKSNIDKCGEGTAEFVSEAIKVYCGI